MKRMLIPFLIIIILMLIAFPVMAQDPPTSPLPTPTPEPLPTSTAEPLPEFEWPDQLPETAQEGLAIIEAFFVFLSGLVTIYTTRWVRKLPILNDQEKSKIAGIVADAVAGVISSVSFVVLAYGVYLAGFLDTNGLWSVLRWVLAVWPTTWLMHKSLKFSRVAIR